jgi:AraC-like DNA-binding protein
VRPGRERRGPQGEAKRAIIIIILTAPYTFRDNDNDNTRKSLGAYHRSIVPFQSPPREKVEWNGSALNQKQGHEFPACAANFPPAMETRPATPPILPHRFARLVAQRPGTAAQHLPLVIYHDEIAGSETVANCHLDFFSLYFVRQGRGTHWIDGVPYGVSRGDVYAMGLGMTHWFADCDRLITDTLHFAPDIFDAPTLNALAETPGFQSLFVEEPLRRANSQGEGDYGKGGRWLHLTPDAYAPVAEMLAELRREWASGTPDGTLLASGLFPRLLVHLARRYAQSRTLTPSPDTPTREASSTQEATVAAAVRYIDEHFAEALRVEQVAASVFLSPDRFTEVFAQTMGRTPRDYIRHLRVERARFLLRTTGLSVSEVGQLAGFGEAAYFTRVFRAASGMTPREFRGRK